MNTDREVSGWDNRGTFDLGLLGEDSLWERRNSDPRAREELISRYLAFAKSIAIGFRNHGEPLDDLVQVANLGLMNAVNRFDPSRGMPFMAFASPTIRGELKRHFRDRTSSIRVPRSLYDRIGRVDKAIDRLNGELGRPPAVSEVANAVGLSREQVLEALEASRRRQPVSIESGTGANEDESPLSDRVGEDDSSLTATEDRLMLGEALRELPARERYVFKLRFGDDLTQEEIAKRIDRSQMHVSRILRRTLDQMKSRIPVQDG